MEQHWTTRDDETEISHNKLLGHGGYGEVHKVRAFCSPLIDPDDEYQNRKGIAIPEGQSMGP